MRFDFYDILRFISRFQAPVISAPPVSNIKEEESEFKIHWIDWTGRKKTKRRGKRKGFREWLRITGITLHQTAVNILNPETCLNIPVHGVVMAGGPDGADVTIILLHDPTDYMYHANGFNRRDIGIEICCRAAGIEDDPETEKDESKWTLWLPKILRSKGDPRQHASEATDAELEGCRRLIQYYCDQADENDGGIVFIHAHRQATKNRVSDPGSRIWQACGEWAREVLGLKVGPPDFKISDGKALPDAWTGRPNGVRYNWKVDARLDKQP